VVEVVEEMMHLVVENPTEVGVGVVNSEVGVIRLVEEEGSQNLVREHQGLKTCFFFISCRRTSGQKVIWCRNTL
jgi:hypothetical protein